MGLNFKELNSVLYDLRPKMPHILPARWRKILAQRNLKVFTVKKSGKIAGMAILRWHDLPVGKVGMAEDVVVAKEYRGKGHGEHLMKQIILFAKKKKMAYIDLTSRPERIAANGLYQKMGWERRETNVYRLVL